MKAGALGSWVCSPPAPAAADGAHRRRAARQYQVQTAGCAALKNLLMLSPGSSAVLALMPALMARVTQSVGLAFLFVPMNTLAFAFVPKERTNYATGLINLARNIGGSTGIALVTTTLARRAQFHQQTLVSHLTPLDPAYNDMLGRASKLLVARGSDAVQAAHQAHGLLYGLVQQP